MPAGRREREFRGTLDDEVLSCVYSEIKLFNKAFLLFLVDSVIPRPCSPQRAIGDGWSVRLHSLLSFFWLALPIVVELSMQQWWMNLTLAEGKQVNVSFYLLLASITNSNMSSSVSPLPLKNPGYAPETGRSLLLVNCLTDIRMRKNLKMPCRYISMYNISFSSSIAWIGSLPGSVMYAGAPISTSLCQRYGCRAVTIASAVVCIVAMVLSSFYSSVYHLYVTHGVIWGLGVSLGYFPTFVVISKYFKTRLSLANGIITCGGSVGTLTLAPVAQWLIDKFGLSSSFRILAAVHSIIFACGLVYRPLQDKATAPSPNTVKSAKYFDWTILKNPAFLAYAAALSFVMLGYIVPYVHLVSFLLNLI